MRRWSWAAFASVEVAKFFEPAALCERLPEWAMDAAKDVTTT